MLSSRSFLFITLAISALAFAILPACSSATGGGTKVDFCGQKYVDPLMMKSDDGVTILKQTPLQSGTQFAPDQGDYSYQSAFAFYNDVENDIRFLVAETRDPATGLLRPPAAVCSGGRGATPTMKPRTYTIPFVSEIQSDGTSTMARTRAFVVTYGMPTTDACKSNACITMIGDNKAAFQPYDVTSTYKNSPDFTTLSQSFNSITVRNFPFNFALASYLTRPTKDRRGRDSAMNMRVLVYMQTVTQEQRDKIENPPAPIDKNKKPKP